MSHRRLNACIWSTVLAAMLPNPTSHAQPSASVEVASGASPSPCAPMLGSEDPRTKADPVVVVWKKARKAALYRQGKLVQRDEGAACWTIGLAMGYPEGHKQRSGDLKTPEGWYRTSDKPWSQFDHAIAVHYPNTEDALAGVADGRIDQPTADRIRRAIASDRKPPQDTVLGGEILLHSGGATDWTLGCVAFDETDILDLRTRLPKDMRFDVWILP